MSVNFDDLVQSQPQQDKKPVGLDFSDLVPQDSVVPEVRAAAADAPKPVQEVPSGPRTPVIQAYSTYLKAREMAKGNAALDLPSLPDKAEFAKATPLWKDARNVFSSPGSMADAFIRAENLRLERKAYTKGEDENGNMVIMRGGEPWAYPNQPGADWRDFRDAAVRSAPHILAGIATGGATAGLGPVARVTALGAAEMGAEALAQAVSYDPFSPGMIALAGLTGFGAEALAPIFSATARGLSKRQIAEGREEAIKAGVADPKELTSILFAQKKNGLFKHGADDQALIAIGEGGVPFTRAEAMPSATTQQRLARDKQLATETGVKADSPELAMVEQERQLALGGATDDLRQSYVADRPEADMGEELIDLIHGEAKHMKGEATALYRTREFSEQYGVPTDTAVNLQNRLSDIKRLEGLGKPGMMGKATKQVDNVINGVNQRIEDAVKNGWSVKELDDIYRMINFNQIGAKGGNKAIIQKVKTEYRDWLENKIMPSLDEDELMAMRDALDASDLWGQYSRTFNKTGSAIDAAIRDAANGDADPELIGRAIFGGEDFNITAKQAHRLVSSVPEGKQAAMLGIMREGIMRRVLASPKSGETREAAIEIATNLNRMLGKGDRTHLVDYAFRKGTKMRRELETYHDMVKFIASVDKAKLVTEAGMKKLSAIYGRFNTPFGIRMVLGIPNIPSKVLRRVLGKQYADAARMARRGQLSRQKAGATMGAIQSGPLEYVDRDKEIEEEYQ
jgi:hypothetical protein